MSHPVDPYDFHSYHRSEKHNWKRDRRRPRPHHWSDALPTKRRFLIWRFKAVFRAMIILFIIFIVAVKFLIDPQKLGFLNNDTFTLIVVGLPVGFALLVILIGGLGFRRFSAPLANVMAAADAVAEGDLSVRLKETGPGEFGNLARSFNRMASELERADQQRRNLTADVAHELRTPLHIIQGNLEGILDGVYQADPKTIQASLDETHLLARLVDDLQTLSLAEAGQLPLHPVPVTVADLLADVHTGFEGQAAEAGVSLEVDIPEKVGDLELQVDPDRMGQVLNNLVINALHHTPAGGTIRLGAEALPEIVRLIVQDNGAGIPAEDLPYIFDRFWRSDRARTRQEGSGSGLGLAIARQLVQAHGGKISAESQPGEGTRFIIDLPGE
jgi:signal transduction histidine kinase